MNDDYGDYGYGAGRFSGYSDFAQRTYGGYKPPLIVPKSHKPNGTFPLRLGNIQADILGGPYANKPDDHYGIKMAVEIKDDCVISIPTCDFDTPDMGRFVAGLYCGITLAQQRVPIWVGCRGGIGRTGLYFAGLAKVMSEYRKLLKKKAFDPIWYIRATYLSHAVETAGQKKFITELNAVDIAKWAMAVQGYRVPWFKRLIGAV
jgi:hypothetical protein